MSSSMMIDIIKICSIFGEDTTLFGHYPPSSARTSAPGIPPMSEDCIVVVGLAAPFQIGPRKAIDLPGSRTPGIPIFV